MAKRGRTAHGRACTAADAAGAAVIADNQPAAMASASASSAVAATQEATAATASIAGAWVWASASAVLTVARAGPTAKRSAPAELAAESKPARNDSDPVRTERLCGGGGAVRAVRCTWERSRQRVVSELC